MLFVMQLQEKQPDKQEKQQVRDSKRTLFETTVEVAKVTLSAVIELTTGVTNLSKMSFSQTAKLLNMMANQLPVRCQKHEKRMAGLQKD